VVATAQRRCTVVNEMLANKPSEWAQNAIDLLNYVPTVDLQTIRVKDRTMLIFNVNRNVWWEKLQEATQERRCGRIRS
jgi:hypothetical protein